MNEQETLDYARIAQAIGYIRENFKRQPGLDEIAREVALSTAHFQRMFTEWAGVSPKKFLQYTSIEYAKKILDETHASLFDTAQETGLSGTGRLYDLFVNIEGMTPGEYKNGGENLSINYSFAKSPFGELFIASTNKGICCLEFADDHDAAFHSLLKKFPNATFTPAVDEMQQNALSIFTQDWRKLKDIKLHLKGTDFQLKVWETLLKIPVAGLTTYGDIAAGINNPKACRAVGTAVGENPVAFLIPCHRVIRSSGELGNYHWGEIRKTAIIGWEAAKNGYLNKYKAGSFEILAAIHKYLFGEIYDFAGKVRNVNIAKGNFRFAPVMYLQAAIENIEKMPQSTFDEIVEKYVEMNIAHPFREGNGRSTRIWLDLILKKELNKVIDWSLVDKEDYLLAMERSPIRDIEIKYILKQALTDKVNDREVYMKGIDYSYYYEGYVIYKAENL
mgnify:CR=1 FL=1